MLKKMMLLAAAVAALVAFAAPASASASEWYHVTSGTHTTLPENEKKTILFSGTARFTVPSVASSYTCVVHASVTIWNEGGSAKSESRLIQHHNK